MGKVTKRITTVINKETGKYEKLDIKAPKGQRRLGIDQNNKLIIYDDKGNIVAVQG